MSWLAGVWTLVVELIERGEKKKAKRANTPPPPQENILTHLKFLRRMKYLIIAVMVGIFVLLSDHSLDSAIIVFFVGAVSFLLLYHAERKDKKDLERATEFSQTGVSTSRNAGTLETESFQADHLVGRNPEAKGDLFLGTITA